MSRNNARETVANFGIEQGDKLLKGRNKDSMPMPWIVEIVEIQSNAEGPQEYVVEITCNGKTIDDQYSVEEVAQWVRGGWVEHIMEPKGDDEDEPVIVTDGGQVVDDDNYTVEDYPDVADENEQLVGLNEWGAWYYDPVMGRLHNYKRVGGQGKTPMDETEGACEELVGEELAERLADLDIVTERGYSYIHKHGGTDVVVNALMSHGLSPGQAWAYYGVVILGNSRNSWAARCGYSDHSAVSEAVRKARRKLPSASYGELSR